MIDFLGYAGLIIGAMSFPGQIYKIYRNKSANDIAWSFLSMSLFSLVSVLIYAISKNTDLYIVLYYGFMILSFVTMITQKCYYNLKENQWIIK